MHIGTFVGKRQILGAILIANELIESRKHIRVDGAIYKINLEKCTIDHVEWEFWDYVVGRLGFGEK